MENSNNEIENLLIICAADEGKLKILLKKREKEPYKGYWILPGEFLENDITLEESSKKIFSEIAPFDYLKNFESITFTNPDRYENKRVVALTNVIITDKQLIDLKKEKENIEWFDIDNLPKLGFDHKEIIEEVSKDIKDKVTYNHDDILLYLFPSDFTLPELQTFYENTTNEEADKHNFQKKLISQNLIIDTGEKDNSKNGRPSVLYRFDEEKMRGNRL